MRSYSLADSGRETHPPLVDTNAAVSTGRNHIAPSAGTMWTGRLHLPRQRGGQECWGPTKKGTWFSRYVGSSVGTLHRTDGAATGAAQGSYDLDELREDGLEGAGSGHSSPGEWRFVASLSEYLGTTLAVIVGVECQLYGDFS